MQTTGSVTMSHVSNQTTIPEAYHLTGIDNYGSWAFRMKNILQRDGLYDFCITPPSNPVTDAERKGRQATMSAINSSVKGGVALKLLKRYSEPHDCWTSLKSRYESDCTERQMLLIDKFFTIRKTGSMDEYLADVKEAADQMEEVEVGLPEKVVVYHTIKNLPKEYDTVKQVILGAKPQPSYLELESRLLNEEMARKQDSSHERDSEALAVNFRSGSRRFSWRGGPMHQGGRSTNHGYNSGGQRGPHSSSVFNHHSRGGYNSGSSSGGGSNWGGSNWGGSPNSNWSGSASNQDYPNRFQHKPDHRPKPEALEQELRSLIGKVKDLEFKLQCEEKDRKKRNQPSQVHNVEAEYAPEEPIEGDGITDECQEDDGYASQVVDAYLTEVNHVDIQPASTAWYLDSGASNHVTGSSSVFLSMSPSHGTKITSAGGHSHDVTGTGDVAIRLPNGEIQKVTHVLYSPGIMKNLLSVGFLADKGFRIEFSQSTCTISNQDGQPIATASRESRNGLYRLVGETLTDCSEIDSSQEIHAMSCTSNNRSSVALWHRRLGHFHSQGLRRMISAGAVKGMPKLTISNSTCMQCLKGKQSRKAIPKQRTTDTTGILQLVHSDIAGPFRTRSLGGSLYFITFIDDFSKKTWVYFLNSKSECFQTFRSFHQEVEKTTGQKLLILRTDNGGEYTSKEFSSYCSKRGIKRQFSQPYTPQHNGVAERKNRTLLDIVRCFLLDGDLPGRLWAEAVRAACIVTNLRPSKRTPDRTPDELFTGIKPNLSNLRAFGSLAYVYNTSPTRGKLEPRSRPCIHLSFDQQVKGFRCFDPALNKIIISKDVQILEKSPPILNPEPSASTSPHVPISGPLLFFFPDPRSLLTFTFIHFATSFSA
jgi:transposase InsO family protein